MQRVIFAYHLESMANPAIPCRLSGQAGSFHPGKRHTGFPWTPIARRASNPLGTIGGAPAAAKFNSQGRTLMGLNGSRSGG